MYDDRVNAAELVDLYGPEIAEKLLQDMLTRASSEDHKKDCKRALDHFKTFLLTDEKGIYGAQKDTFEATNGQLPPFYVHDCVKIWLFDDAFISLNTVANYYHGYCKKNGHTVPLGDKEVAGFREIIENPKSLLGL